MYRLEGEDGLAKQGVAIYMHWSNPYLGNNKCGISLVTLLTSENDKKPFFIPYTEGKFEVVSTCGAGNKAAEMRFELHEEA